MYNKSAAILGIISPGNAEWSTGTVLFVLVRRNWSQVFSCNSKQKLPLRSHEVTVATPWGPVTNVIQCILGVPINFLVDFAQMGYGWPWKQVQV